MADFEIHPKYCLDPYQNDCYHKCLFGGMVEYLLGNIFRMPGWYIHLFNEDDKNNGKLQKVKFCPICGINLSEIDDGWVIISKKEVQDFIYDYYLDDSRGFANLPADAHIFPTKQSATQKVVELNSAQV